jgi:signal transduction histidine kinase
MKNFFRTLYGKISTIFLSLLIVMAMIQIWVSLNTSQRFVQESDQKLNRELAQSIALEFKPFLEDSIHYGEIEQTMHYLMVMNPRVEIYLLDDRGKIITFFAEPRKKVKQDDIALEPIRHFLADDAPIPILGDDPRNPGRKKTFSVAPAQIGPDTQGYIYVILAGEQYDSAAEMIRESYILSIMARALFIVFLGTGVVGLILFALLTKRFRAVTSTVREFTHGRYTSRIAIDSKDELGELAFAFNKMADTIVANMDELKRMDDLRRELVANVSHDLRSPLASIQGYLETIMMKEKSLSPVDKQKYLKIIYDNSKMLNMLVAELFELSKLDARQIEPKEELFSMAELTQDVVMKFKPLAEKLRVDLRTNLSKKPTPVMADIGLIERALSNLLDNAIRYTPEKGVVKVTLSKKGEQVFVSVSNTGEGIAAEDLPKVFERFYRADRSRARATGGAGLGLAIANKIIELHNSTIHVQSVLNEQTTFSFALPSQSGR